MSHPEQIQNRIRWTLRTVGWLIAFAILFTLAYRMMFRKHVERVVDCLDQAASAQRATSASAAVEKYAACVARQSTPPAAAQAGALPPRCRYAGVWTATRGDMVYEVTLEADGKFVAEPAQNSPAHAQAVSGAWTVAGNALVWAYDSDAVWPPDINPISAQSDAAFTLTEVNGSTTRYSLIERATPEACQK